MVPQVVRRCLGILLLGLVMLIGLASTAVAQTFPGQTGVGFAPNEDYIDLYYNVNQAITPVQFPAAIGGTAPLTYSLDGGHASLGFAFDETTRTFSGTPTLAGSGDARGYGFELTYSVDGQGGGFDQITVFVTVCETGGDPSGATSCSAPAFTALTLTAPADQSYMVGVEINLELPAATGGTGSNPLFQYLLSPLPAGLSFISATHTLSGIPTTATTGPITVTYGVTDAASKVQATSQTFTISVASAPVLSALPDLDLAFLPIVLPVATGGTAPLNYALTGLPAGLMFDAATRTLSGTSTAVGEHSLTYTATDANGATASGSSVITVPVPVDDRLVFSAVAPVPPIYTMEATAITDLILPAATGGEGSLFYTLSPLPAGLEFNAATHTLSGTLTAVGSAMLTYTATDLSTGATASLMFTVELLSRLVFLDAVMDQGYTMGTEIFDLILPAATGGIGSLIYTLTDLPAGLSFNTATHTLSGTPTAAGSTMLTYTATDLSTGVTTSLMFTVAVAIRGEAPPQVPQQVPPHAATSISGDLAAVRVNAPPVLNPGADDGSATEAVFRGGASSDGGDNYFKDGAFSAGEALDIVFVITPRASDVDEQASVVIAARMRSAPETVWLLTESGPVPYDGETLVSFKEGLALEANNFITLTPEGPVTLSPAEVGNWELFISYRLADGTLFSHPEPLRIEVME